MHPGTSATDGPRLVELEIADDPTAWTAAGFEVHGDLVDLGGVGLRLVGTPADGRRGVRGWVLAGLARATTDLDGLPTTTVAATPSPPAPGRHRNGAVGLDHVVVLTPDLQRTIDACEAVGMVLRRIRDTESYGSPMRQAFFRLGPTILEVVSGDTGSGVPSAEAPATWFGLAVDVEDLDQTAAALGEEGLGAIKAAVQRGRRIATFRHRHFGMSVAVAAMDRHGDR